MNPSPKPKVFRRKKDIAWGFFFYSAIEKRRVLHSEPSEARAGIIRSAEWHGTDRGPVFRITPPTEIRKPRTGKGRGK